MMKNLLKNIDYSTVLPLAEQTTILQGQVVSKTLVQNAFVNLTLFAFDRDEEISTHSSEGDALIIGLEGAGTITIDDEKYLIKAGESIVMPSNHPHAVYATEQFKMLLLVIFSTDKK